MINNFMDYLRRLVCVGAVKYMQLPLLAKLLLLPITIVSGILLILVCWIAYFIEYGKYGKKGWQMQKQDQAEWINKNLSDIVNKYFKD